MGLFNSIGAVLLAFATSVAIAAVPTPEVSLPPAGLHGFAFGTSAIDLAAYGYTEQEFFISGQARSFVAASDFGSDGKWNSTPSNLTGQYKVRMLVRRPADPRRFNGTVLVEWLNVSGFYERTPEWSYIHDELLREGYAYVGVTAQYVGADLLKAWEQGDGARYRDVSHPGDSFSYDIFSQAAMAIRDPRPGDPQPLGPLTSGVRAVIGMGQSQSGDRMVTYANAVQREARVYDGLIIHSAFSSAPLSQASAASFPTIGDVPLKPGMPVTPDVPTPQPARVRDDLKQPVMVLSTETEVNSPNIVQGIHQQPDSKRIRIWEIAGAGHADVDSLASMNADLAKSGIVQTNPNCGDLATNDGKMNGQASRAALVAMQRWLRMGIKPSVAPRLQVDLSTDPPHIERDPATGLALGGIRLPEVSVPTRTLTGVRPATMGGPFCFLFGGTDSWNGDVDSYDGLSDDPSPTPEPVLTQLYPTSQDYQFKVFMSGIKSVFTGFMLPEDFLESLEAASETSFSQ